MKITKKLFEAVMGYNPIGDFPIQDNIVDLQGAENDFFFKCKEFAYKKLCLLCSNNNSQGGVCELVVIGDFKDNKLFRADSEQQAVFDACEWVLDNKDTK